MGKNAIVVGAGIAGLAMARALATRDYKVKVIERNEKAVGASIRNFGMIWPIGQPAGELYERALLSKDIWKQVCSEAGIWYDEVGSLHLAYAKDEWDVMQELADLMGVRRYKLLNTDQTIQLSGNIVKENHIGSLYSTDEMIVDPREAISRISAWLTEKYGVEFIWGKAVTDIVYPSVYAGQEEYDADEIFVCSGADFETLYPQLYSTQPITKCKLQMMRMGVQPARVGPSLCGALSLLHYQGFKTAPSLPQLRQRLEDEYPEYIQYGIHVMVSQNQSGELTVGDSHEYGLTPDPFDKHHINRLILDYLAGFARFNNETITETWNGIYPKMTNGQTDVILHPEHGVTIVNGFGGAGMTLAFGLCEQLMTSTLSKALKGNAVKT
jgi:FAD dependent oxidoreductase TIGR03364